MGLKPMDDRIIVKRLDPEEVSPGGIIIPKMSQEKSQQAVVVAVGPGRTLDSGVLKPMNVSVSDIVMIGKYSGSEIKIDGEEHLLMSENEVMAIVTEDDLPEQKVDHE